MPRFSPTAFVCGAIWIAGVTAAHLKAQPEIVGLGFLGTETPCRPIAISADGKVVVGSCNTTPNEAIQVASTWAEARGWTYGPGAHGGETYFSFFLSCSADGSRLSAERQIATTSGILGWRQFTINIDGTGEITHVVPDGHWCEPDLSEPAGFPGGLSPSGAFFAYGSAGPGPDEHTVCAFSAVPAIWSMETGDEQIAIAYGVARAASDTGVVVGFTTPGPDLDVHPSAFTSSKAGGLKTLPPLEGEPDAVAAAVTADGAIVFGYSGLIDKTFMRHGKMVRWPPGGGKPSDIGFFQRQPYYWIGSSALAANGRMILVSLDAGPSLGLPGGFSYIWTARDGQMLVENYFSMVGGDLGMWTLTYASGLSADGSRIVGIGVNPSGKDEGYMLIVPPYCDADCNADGKLNINDFICFQARWRTADLYSDFNDDGAWNINDFLAFQSAFIHGCP